MAKVTRHYLTELRELEKRATPGPWGWTDGAGHDPGPFLMPLEEYFGVEIRAEDEALLRAMREALPALLRVAEAARAAEAAYGGSRERVAMDALREALDALEAP